MSESPRTTIQGSLGSSPTLQSVFYGPGCVSNALPKLIKSFGVKKALVVTGNTLRTKTDVVKKVETILEQHDAHGATFSGIGEHAPIAGILKAVDQLKELRADFLVSVGGGSPIDAAKAIAYRFKDTPESGGKILPHFGIPTTLSAAEYTSGAGYTGEDGHKIAVISPEIGLSGIILDAELTLPTPERLWLSTGMRAMDHAVETMYRPNIAHPVKFLGYGAIADLFKYLPLSKANPENVEYRQRLLIAAWMSLWPIRFHENSPIGISHLLGHKLGATYSIPHGMTSCLTLAAVVKLQSELASPEDKKYLADILFHLGVPSTGSVDGDILLLSDLLDKLVVQLGLKTTLEAYKVPREDLPKIAERALGSKEVPAFSKVVGLLETIYA
ncbi:alcohol dehydrogenase IV [Schizopora paradoxa]|uniref:Alcohol dehydrogenase IV n=1 Tax=Schizopora paradoxa TaxID=27342 RepID=A0A0H2RCA5_9AGAM|nr:alcohol dehydrogenase IV [Schizopora paradoxa]